MKVTKLKNLLLVLSAFIATSCSKQPVMFEHFSVELSESNWIIDYTYQGETGSIAMDYPIFEGYDINEIYSDVDEIDIWIQGRMQYEIFAENYEHIAYSDNGWSACITNGGKSIKTYQFNPNDKSMISKTIELPLEFKAKTIAIKENVLYVGGYSSKEFLGLYNLEKKNPKWKRINIPKKLTNFGKAIDDLLIFKDTLVVIDDTVIPKWSIKYNINKPSKPRLQKIYSFTQYDMSRIVKGIRWNDRFILFDKSQSFIKGESIVIFNDDFEEEYQISNTMFINEEKQNPNQNADYADWYSIEVIDNTILIASRKGLGILDLPRTGDFSNLQDSIRYLEIVDYEDWEVFNVIVGASSKRVFLVLSNLLDIKVVEFEMGILE